MLMEAKIYETDRLKQLGFVNETYNGDPLLAGTSLVELLLNKQTDVLVAYKQMLVRKWEATRLKERIEKEVSECAILWEKDAHHEAVDRFMGD